MKKCHHVKSNFTHLISRLFFAVAVCFTTIFEPLIILLQTIDLLGQLVVLLVQPFVLLGQVAKSGYFLPTFGKLGYF